MRLRYSALLLAFLFATGCGSSGPFEYTPVNGTVTYDDGTPLPGSFKLIFYAQDAAPVGNAVPRPARASVNEQGVFECVTSHKYGDGLIPGKHKVVIQVASEHDGKPVLAREYGSSETTPLVVDTADAPLAIKVPKP
jgi:hypothetical protein